MTTLENKGVKERLFIYTWIFAALGLSFQHHYLGFLTVPALAGCWLVFNDWRNKYFLRLLFLSSLFYFGLVWGWLLFIEPAGWSPLQGYKAKIIIVLFWLLLSLICSFSLSLSASLWKYIQSSRNTTYTKSILTFVSLWVLQEFFRSYLISLIFAGDGSSFGPHWNFGVIGIALTSMPFTLPLSSTIGMYGMSAIGVLMGITAYTYYTNKTGRHLLLLILALTHLVGWQLSLTYRNNAGEYREVSALNTASKTTYYNNYIDENLKIADILIFPEYSGLFDDPKILKTNMAKNMFIDRVTNSNSTLLTSLSDHSNVNTTKNRLTAYNNEGVVISSQDKTFLIPGGEFLPYWLETIVQYSSETLINDYNSTLKVTQGTDKEEPVNAHGIRIGALACSGVISPSIYRDLANNGAQILSNSASLTIVEGSEIFHQQTIGFAKFNSAANQKPFIQSTKAGKSYILNSNGKILSKTTTAENKYISEQVQLSNSKTIYTRFGEFIICISMIYIAYSFYSARMSKSKFS